MSNTSTHRVPSQAESSGNGQLQDHLDEWTFVFPDEPELKLGLERTNRKLAAILYGAIPMNWRDNKKALVIELPTYEKEAKAEAKAILAQGASLVHLWRVTQEEWDDFSLRLIGFVQPWKHNGETILKIGLKPPCPQILITTDEMDVNNQAISSLSRDEDIYRFGFKLARVAYDSEGTRGIEYPDGPTPIISTLGTATLRERMASTANWIKKVSIGEGKTKEVPTHPPAWSVAAVHERGIYPGIRPIVGVIESPAIRPDGSILDKPGYDPATRLFFQPNCNYEPIPRNPTLDDAKAAVEDLLDLVNDFPFKDETHKHAWLCHLLTLIGRSSFRGPAPICAVDGNMRGAGKGMLINIIGIIATGRRMPLSTWPSNRDADEEIRKRITALVLKGARMTFLDNVDAPLGGAPLDAALTGDTWEDRLLGRNESTPPLPLNLVWFATGNNLTYRGDCIRRVVAARLMSPTDSPEERTDFKYPDLLAHVTIHRARYVKDALTILRAYHVAGKPKQVTPLGSFGEWSRAIVDPIVWATGINPLDVRAGIKDSDVSLQRHVALVEGWLELPGGNKGLTAATALSYLKKEDANAKYPILSAILPELTDKGDLPSARSLGRYLMSVKDKPVGDHVMVACPPKNHVIAWKVVTRSPQGFEGFEGFICGLTREKAGQKIGEERQSKPANPSNPAPAPPLPINDTPSARLLAEWAREDAERRSWTEPVDECHDDELPF